MAEYNLSANLSIQKVIGIQQAVNQVEQGFKNAKIDVNVSVSGTSLRTLDELNARISKIQNNLRGLTSSSAQASSAMASIGGSATTSLNSVNVSAATASSSIHQVGTSSVLAERGLHSFSDNITLTARRFVAFTVAAGGIISVFQGIRGGISAALDFERQMVRLSQVSGETKGQIGEIASEVSVLSRTLGVSSQELITQGVTLKQAGLNARETAQALRAVAEASLAPNFSGMNQIVEGSIAILQQFDRNTVNLSTHLGAMNEVAGAFAVEAADLVTVTRSAGGAFKQTGGTLNELLGLFTSVRSTTRESADSIATGLRTIFTRLQRSDTVDTLRQFNIELRHTAESAAAFGDVNLTGQFVGGAEAIRRISEGLAGLRTTDSRYTNILEQLGGYRQISRVIPLLNEFGVAQRAINVAQSGNISLQIAAEKAQDSLLVKTQGVKEQYLELFRTITGSKGFKDFAKDVLSAATAFERVLFFVKPLIPLMLTFAGIKIVQSIPSFISSANARLGYHTPPAPAPVRLATGGIVPRTPGSRLGEDSVHTMLTPGEFVVPVGDAQRIGYGKLDSLARRTKFAGGERAFENVFKTGYSPSVARNIFGFPDEEHINVKAENYNSQARLFFNSSKLGLHGVETVGRSNIKGVETLSSEKNGIQLKSTGTGLGSDIFYNQVKNFKKLGFRDIFLNASSEDGANGHYTWPRLGFNGNIPKSDYSKIPKKYKSASNIQELFSIPGGKEWWKENGSDLSLSFDLQNGSRSLEVLKSYRKEKGLSFDGLASGGRVKLAGGYGPRDIADTVLAASAGIDKAYPKSQPLVILGRDLWPTIPVLREKFGRKNAQYFVWSRPQGKVRVVRDKADIFGDEATALEWEKNKFGGEDRIDRRTAEIWQKEVHPDSAVIDTGYEGSIFNAIRLIDKTIPEKNFGLLNSHRNYPEIPTGLNRDKVLSDIEHLEKLTKRGKSYSQHGSLIYNSGETSRDDSGLRTGSVASHIERTKEILSLLGLDTDQVKAYSTFTGTNPQQRIGLSGSLLERHYNEVKRARSSAKTYSFFDDVNPYPPELPKALPFTGIPHHNLFKKRKNSSSISRNEISVNKIKGEKGKDRYQAVLRGIPITDVTDNENDVHYESYQNYNQIEDNLDNTDNKKFSKNHYLDSIKLGILGNELKLVSRSGEALQNILSGKGIKGTVPTSYRKSLEPLSLILKDDDAIRRFTEVKRRQLLERAPKAKEFVSFPHYNSENYRGDNYPTVVKGENGKIGLQYLSKKDKLPLSPFFDNSDDSVSFYDRIYEHYNELGTASRERKRNVGNLQFLHTDEYDDIHSSYKSTFKTPEVYAKYIAYKEKKKQQALALKQLSIDDALPIESYWNSGGRVKLAGGSGGLPLLSNRKSLSEQEIIDQVMGRSQSKQRAQLLLDGIQGTNTRRLIPKGSKFIGHGLAALAFKTPENEVLRIQPHIGLRPFEHERSPDGRTYSKSVFSYNRPNNEAILQNTASNLTGNVLTEKLPFVQSIQSILGESRAYKLAEHTPDLAKALSKQLKNSNLYYPDMHTGNVGILGGKAKIIDPGSIMTRYEAAKDKLGYSVESQSKYESLIAMMLGESVPSPSGSLNLESLQSTDDRMFKRLGLAAGGVARTLGSPKRETKPSFDNVAKFLKKKYGENFNASGYYTTFSESDRKVRLLHKYTDDKVSGVDIDFTWDVGGYKEKETLQPNTINFIKSLHQLASELAKNNIDISFTPTDERRERLYTNAVSKIGYERAGSSHYYQSRSKFKAREASNLRERFYLSPDKESGQITLSENYSEFSDNSLIFKDNDVKQRFLLKKRELLEKKLPIAKDFLSPPKLTESAVYQELEPSVVKNSVGQIGFQTLYDGLPLTKFTTDFKEAQSNNEEATKYQNGFSSRRSAVHGLRDLFSVNRKGGIINERSQSLVSHDNIDRLYNNLPDYVKGTLKNQDVLRRYLTVARRKGLIPIRVDDENFLHGENLFASGGRAKLASGDEFPDGKRTKLASGGWVVPGTGHSDTFPADLPVGSFVIRKSSAERIGHQNLAAMAQGRRTAFADGGRAKPVIPALLMPGEFVFNPDAAAKVGMPRLHVMNVEGRVPMASGGRVNFANGGDDESRERVTKVNLTPLSGDFQLDNLPRSNYRELYQKIEEIIGSAKYDITNIKNVVVAIKKGGKVLFQEIGDLKSTSSEKIEGEAIKVKDGEYDTDEAAKKAFKFYKENPKFAHIVRGHRESVQSGDGAQGKYFKNIEDVAPKTAETYLNRAEISAAVNFDESAVERKKNESLEDARLRTFESFAKKSFYNQLQKNSQRVDAKRSAGQIPDVEGGTIGGGENEYDRTAFVPSSDKSPVEKAIDNEKLRREREDKSIYGGQLYSGKPQTAEDTARVSNERDLTNEAVYSGENKTAKLGKPKEFRLNAKIAKLAKQKGITQEEARALLIPPTIDKIEDSVKSVQAPEVKKPAPAPSTKYPDTYGKVQSDTSIANRRDTVAGAPDKVTKGYGQDKIRLASRGDETRLAHDDKFDEYLLGLAEEQAKNNSGKPLPAQKLARQSQVTPIPVAKLLPEPDYGDTTDEPVKKRTEYVYTNKPKDTRPKEDFGEALFERIYRKKSEGPRNIEPKRRAGGDFLDDARTFQDIVDLIKSGKSLGEIRALLPKEYQRKRAAAHIKDLFDVHSPLKNGPVQKTQPDVEVAKVDKQEPFDHGSPLGKDFSADFNGGGSDSGKPIFGSGGDSPKTVLDIDPKNKTRLVPKSDSGKPTTKSKKTDIDIDELAFRVYSEPESKKTNIFPKNKTKVRGGKTQIDQYSGFNPPQPPVPPIPPSNGPQYSAFDGSANLQGQSSGGDPFNLYYKLEGPGSHQLNYQQAIAREEAEKKKKAAADAAARVRQRQDNKQIIKAEEIQNDTHFEFAKIEFANQQKQKKFEDDNGAVDINKYTQGKANLVAAEEIQKLGGESAISETTAAGIKRKALDEATIRVKREFIDGETKAILAQGKITSASEARLQAEANYKNALERGQKVLVSDANKGINQTGSNLLTGAVTAGNLANSGGSITESSLLSRIGSWFRDKSTTIKDKVFGVKEGNESGSNPFALGAQLALPYIQEGIRNLGGEASEAATRGETGSFDGRFSVARGISGAIGGGLIGGVVASAAAPTLAPIAASLTGLSVPVIGPFITGIGIVTGGLTSLYSSLKEAEQEIRTVKINRAMDVFADRLQTLANLGSQAHSSVRAEAISNLRTERELTDEETRAQISTFYNAGGSSESYTDRFSQNTRQRFGGQLSNFTQYLSRDAEEIGRNNVGRNLNELEETLRNGGGGVNREFIRLVAEIRRVSQETVTRELRDSISAGQRAEQVRREQVGASRVNVNLSNLGRTATGAEAAVDDTRLQRTLFSALSNGTTPVPVNFGANRFANLGTFDTENNFENSLGFIGRAFGTQGVQAGNIARQSNLVAQVLPDVILQARGQGRIGETPGDYVNRVRTGLTEQFGGRAAVQANEHLTNIIESVISGINELTSGGLHNLEQALSDVSTLSTNLLGPSNRPLQAIQQAITTLQGQQNEYIQNLSTINQLRSQSLETQNRAVTAGINTRRQEADFTDYNRFATRGSALRNIPVGELTADFQQRLEGLTGQRGNNARNPQLVGRLIRDERVNEQRLIREQSDVARSNGDVSGVARQLSDSRQRIQNYNQALETMTDATRANAAIQERLNDISQQRDSRLSYAQRFASASPEQRQELNRGVIALIQAHRQGNLNGVSDEDLRRINDTGQAFRGVYSPALGSNVDTAVNNLYRRTPAFAPLINGPAGEADEVARLQNAARVNSGNAEAAYRELATTQVNNVNTLMEFLSRQQTNFFSQFRTQLDRGNLTSSETRQGALTRDLQDVTRQQGYEDVLRSIGVTNNRQYSTARSSGISSAITSLFDNETVIRRSNEIRNRISSPATDYRLSRVLGDNQASTSTINTLFGPQSSLDSRSIRTSLSDFLSQIPGLQQPQQERIITNTLTNANAAAYHRTEFRTGTPPTLDQISSILTPHLQAATELELSGTVEGSVTANAINARRSAVRTITDARLNPEAIIEAGRANVTAALNAFEGIGNDLESVGTRYQRITGDLDRVIVDIAALRTRLNLPPVAAEPAGIRNAQLPPPNPNDINVLPALPSGQPQSVLANIDGEPIQGGTLEGFMRQVRRFLRPIGQSSGGLIGGYADGGRVGNSPIGFNGAVPDPSMFLPMGTDTVPALLANGSFVIKRSAAEKHRSMLDSMVSGYSSGGVVPAMLTPGEHVVPPQIARDNLGMLHAMNSGGNVGYFEDGGNADYLRRLNDFRSFQSRRHVPTPVAPAAPVINDFAPQNVINNAYADAFRLTRRIPAPETPQGFGFEIVRPRNNFFRQDPYANNPYNPRNLGRSNGGTVQYAADGGIRIRRVDDVVPVGGEVIRLRPRNVDAPIQGGAGGPNRQAEILAAREAEEARERERQRLARLRGVRERENAVDVFADIGLGDAAAQRRRRIALEGERRRRREDAVANEAHEAGLFFGFNPEQRRQLFFNAQTDRFGAAGALLEGRDGERRHRPGGGGVRGRELAIERNFIAGQADSLRDRQLEAQTVNPFARFGISRADSQNQSSTNIGISSAGQSLRDKLKKTSSIYELAGDAREERNRRQWETLGAGIGNIFGGPRPRANGGILSFADGGVVPGNPFGPEDTNLARVSSGEYVLPRRVVSNIGTQSLDRLRRFADGGVVGSAPPINGLALNGLSGAGNTPNAEASQRLAAALTGFSSSSVTLSSALIGFDRTTQTFAKAIESFPSKIQINGHQTHEVIFNGAEVFSSMQGEIKTMVEERAREIVRQIFKENLPQIGATLD